MARNFTREAFYELVWSKPMTHLAKEFGLSDVALHKICKKYDIPNPPLGWWAKKAAGKEVSQTPLPEPSEGIPDRFTITGGELRSEGDLLAVARDNARARLSEFDPLADRIDHTLVTKSFAKLRMAPEAFAGRVNVSAAGLIPVNVAPASIDRVERNLKRIVAAAQALGFDLGIKENRVGFTDGTHTVPFVIEEILDKTKHQPSEAVRAKYESDKRRHLKRWGKTVWEESDSRWLRRPWPEWDYAPSGRISFAFDTHVSCAGSLRKSFRDGKSQSLETMAIDIAVGLAVIFAGKLEDARRAEEARLRYQEAERRRNEAERATYIEEKRTQALQIVFERIVQRDRLHALHRQLSEELESIYAPRTREFLVWLERRLTQAANAASATGFEALFQENRVFGDDDDVGFRPSSRLW